jgi:hypothetical protein
MATNPIKVTLPAYAKISFAAVANAYYVQKITVNVGTESPFVFQGSGEGVVLNLQPPNSGTTKDLTVSFDDRVASIQFLYSSGGGVFNPSVVKTPTVIKYSWGTQTTIRSEDSADNDNNDAEVTIIARY